MTARSLAPALFALAAVLATAQTTPWTATLRGSWVQTGTPAQGDVVLGGTNRASEIVVADDENAAVHQAAEFLAADIEKISGSKPSIVKAPGGGRASIRLVTLGHGSVPAAVNAGGMQGQWESYRIVTEGYNVWFAAYYGRRGARYQLRARTLGGDRHGSGPDYRHEIQIAGQRGAHASVVPLPAERPHTKAPAARTTPRTSSASNPAPH